MSGWVGGGRGGWLVDFLSIPTSPVLMFDGAGGCVTMISSTARCNILGSIPQILSDA